MSPDEYRQWAAQLRDEQSPPTTAERLRRLFD